MQEKDIILEAKNIAKRLSDNVYIDSLNFNMRKGEKLAFIGETGSGKTSVLKIIGGLMQPDNGEVFYKNERVKGPNETLIPGHAKIAYLSQHFELWNNYFVHELLSYSNELTKERSASLYNICQIDHLLNRYSDELSGGEKQRVALAALLTRSPELLLLDEPFSNLDAINKRIIKTVLNDIISEFKLDTVLISHDAADVLSWADKIIVLQSGKIVQTGTPQEVYHYPVNEYCAELLGNYFLLKKTDAIKSTTLPDNRVNNIFFRPEYVSISEKNHSSIEAIIEDVEYFGNHYLLKVKHNGVSFKINAKLTYKTYKTGEIVHFTLLKTPDWYID